MIRKIILGFFKKYIQDEVKSQFESMEGDFKAKTSHLGPGIYTQYPAGQPYILTTVNTNDYYGQPMFTKLP